MIDQALIEEAKKALSIGLTFITDRLEELQAPNLEVLGLEQEDRFNPQASQTQRKGELGERRQDLEDALERIEQGTFGICLDCGQEIPAARLRATIVFYTCQEGGNKESFFSAGYHVKRCCDCQEKHNPPALRRPWRRRQGSISLARFVAKG